MSDEAQHSGSTIRCEACGTGVSAYDIVYYGSIEHGYRELCTSCLNAEMANALGLEDFENVRLHSVVITDCAGERHGFHFRLRLLGSMLMLDAFELTNGGPGGYQFQILGKTGRRTLVAARQPDRAHAPQMQPPVASQGLWLGATEWY